MPMTARNKEKLRMINAEEVKRAIAVLNGTPEWERRSKTMRLYMVCLESELCQPTVQKALKYLNVSL